MLCSIGAIPLLSVVPLVDSWLNPAVVDKFTAERFAARMKSWQPVPCPLAGARDEAISCSVQLALPKELILSIAEMHAGVADGGGILSHQHMLQIRHWLQ
jgi:hypothetical protein